MVTPTTKYTRKGKKTPRFSSNSDKVVIAESDDQVKEYICPSCSRIRHTRQSQGELECLHCGEIINIEGTRRKSKLETPHQNTETLVGSVPTPGFVDVQIKHDPELSGGFKALRDKGLRITDYREDIPS